MIFRFVFFFSADLFFADFFVFGISVSVIVDVSVDVSVSVGDKLLQQN